MRMGADFNFHFVIIWLFVRIGNIVIVVPGSADDDICGN